MNDNHVFTSDCWCRPVVEGLVVKHDTAVPR